MALRTPLYPAHVELGARMVEFAGWDLPVQYQGVLEEHAAVRTACGLFDVSHMGEILVTGPRALEGLQKLVTNDLSKCADGQAQYSALCDEQGFVIDDIIVYKMNAERLFVCVNATGREKDFDWMRAHAIPGATFEQQSDAWAQLAVQGPKAAELIETLCEPRVDELGNYRFKQSVVAGIGGCIVARTGYTGEDGFEIFCPPEIARALWDRLLDDGKPHGLVPCGLGARDSLRLEVAYRLYGNDMDLQHTPLEAGLGWIVKLDKPGGFIGAEALRAQKTAGLKRKLVGLKLTGKGIARQGYPVRASGSSEACGVVTSGTMSPKLKEAIALAYVPIALAAEGTLLDVEIRGKPVPAVVVKTPFIPTATKSS
jgi:aminomethyltransferase